MTTPENKKPVNPVEQKFAQEMGQILLRKQELALSLKANQLLEAVWKARVSLYSLKSEDTNQSRGFWLNSSDGTFTYISFGDFNSCIDITQHTKMKHHNYNFTEDAVGYHYLIKLGQDITAATEIESYDVLDMRAHSHNGGYVGGPFRKAIKLDSEQHMIEGINDGFPVDDFVKLIDSFDGRVN